MRELYWCHYSNKLCWGEYRTDLFGNAHFHVISTRFKIPNPWTIEDLTLSPIVINNGGDYNYQKVLSFSSGLDYHMWIVHDISLTKRHESKVIKRVGTI